MTPTSATQGAYRHEALLYEGREGFLAGTLPFLREGIAAGEPVLVVVAAEKVGWLRAALGAQAPAVQFQDMAVAGRNPARLIPVWRGFVEANRSAPAMRGIGEPIGPDRSRDELAECEQHEALLNVAFADDPPLRLLCPYDTAALPPEVVTVAKRNHPLLLEARGSGPSAEYAPPAGTLEAPLPEPWGEVREMSYEGAQLRAVREFARSVAAELGARPERAGDVTFAAGEMSANSVRHGGGRGVVRLWREGDAVVLEVRDRGRIADPLVGRHQPAPLQPSGRGLWLLNQLGDLVQVRSGAAGTVVRVHFRD